MAAAVSATGGRTSPAGEPHHRLAELVADHPDWEVVHNDPWCVVRPPAHQLPDQGWKLHLSATAANAVEVLDRAAPVLFKHESVFKFAATLRTVRQLGSRAVDRSATGKFLTAYPVDDDHFRSLAEALDAATQGLTGPVVLSDRAYRPGGLLYYRFGGFSSRAVLDNDGIYQPVLTAPDGSTVPDRREARFAPPDWAIAPLPAPAPAAPRPSGQPANAGPTSTAGAATPAAPVRRAVLLGGRYLVRQAVRHSAKGGVFFAEDTANPPAEDGSATVVVKQARPHTECDASGQDSRDTLRNEAAMLDLLAPHGLAPRALDVFEQDGQLFLAEDRLPGEPLRAWVANHSAGRPGVPSADALAMAVRLADLLHDVHGLGIVVRDLSPKNIMIAPDGTPRLVDLELATPAGQAGRRGGTLGYHAPEELDSSAERTVADPAEDLFSLGALYFLLATGNDPMLPADPRRDTSTGSSDSAGTSAATRSVHERLAHWLGVVATEGAAARTLGPAILGLVQDDPALRWDLARVRAFLSTARSASSDGPGSTAPTAPPAAVPGAGSPESRRGRLLVGGIAHLIDTMTPDGRTLWPAGANGAQTDPCNVQHGAAGVLGLLTRVAAVSDPGLPDALPAVRVGGAWLQSRAHRAAERPSSADEPLLPGLYFGRAGAAWALHDAGQLLDDTVLTDAARALADRLPVRWPNPDVTHGMAGAGLAHLHLWQRTGDPTLRERLVQYADAVVEAAQRGPRGISWPVPVSFTSRFAGTTHYGFAHGTAGIGYFLLAAGQATGQDAYLRLASEAGEALCAVAHLDGDAATWPITTDRADTMVHWCNGSSGVGTFLLRLWAATGERRYADLAAAAARAVHQARWQSLPAACHGLAGNGEFLLDAAELLDTPLYREWATDLAELLYVRHAVADGRAVVPDETGRMFSADYNTGLAGVLAFLLRLRLGGGRMWMCDQPAGVRA